jgi:Dolichyl-phosphate-mannose-protein mannosyltransferase
MAFHKETRPRRAQTAERHNRRNGWNIPAAGSVRSTQDRRFSDQDRYSATQPLATVLPVADSWPGTESSTTTSFHGHGYARRQLGSRPIRLRSEKASASRPREGSSLSLSRSPWKGEKVRRRAWVSRFVMLGILIVQALQSLQLQNSAFEDEALYLSAGHLQLGHLKYGHAVPTEFTSYFSGSPVLYPTLAAAVDSAFGLAGARALSLVLMLATTVLLYSISRLLFSELAGLCAAALFGTTQSTLFLGHFATYDATAIFLLALAAWIVVRRAHRPTIPASILAALIMTLGVAVKYATLMFVPTIVILAALTAYAHRRWRGLLLQGLMLCTFTGVILAAAVVLAGKTYIEALRITTTARAHGNADVLDIFLDCLQWGGGLLILGLFGTASYVWREQLSAVQSTMQSDDHARPWRVALGLLLCGTALLAPAYQMYLQTDVSLHKHIGYGLLFAAPMAGLGMTRLMGAHFRYPQLAIVSWVTLLTLGISQSHDLYHNWPDSTQMVAVLRPELKPKGRYLVESDAVPKYYFRNETTPDQWISTYAIDYTDSKRERLWGEPGYHAALKDGYFDLIVLNWTVTKELDNALVRKLRTDDRYRMLGKIPYQTTSGKGYYQIWVKAQPA